MAVRDLIKQMLSQYLGAAFLQRRPELPCEADNILKRFGRSEETLSQLHTRLDSLLFNTIYTCTEKSMMVTYEDGSSARIRSDDIRDLADRLLALAYHTKAPDSLLKDKLFDFAREGSYAAMRELLERFPLDAFDRAWITQVLSENNQLT